MPTSESTLLTWARGALDRGLVFEFACLSHSNQLERLLLIRFSRSHVKSIDARSDGVGPYRNVLFQFWWVASLTFGD